jgi:hypothetical protein
MKNQFFQFDHAKTLKAVRKAVVRSGFTLTRSEEQLIEAVQGDGLLFSRYALCIAVTSTSTGYIKVSAECRLVRKGVIGHLVSEQIEESLLDKVTRMLTARAANFFVTEPVLVAA